MIETFLKVHISLINGAHMHIPDGYLDPFWSIITYLVSIVYFVYVLKRFGSVSNPTNMATLTVLAAGIFAAQMLNWPLVGGTSLHFLGGPLAGIVLGPILGSLALAIVVVVQCIVFHDGGITALGANLLNMAILSVLVGYAAFKLVMRLSDKKSNSLVVTGGVVGGWLGVLVAGVACGVEIGLSPQFPYGVWIALQVMGVWHGILGVIEGIITGIVLGYLNVKSPELIKR